MPALTIVAMYCGWSFILSMIRPAQVPALPVEARPLGGGILSLLASLAAAVAIYYATYHTVFAKMTAENRLAMSAVVAVVAIYLAAIATCVMGLGVMSRLAERVVIVLIPPLALIYPVLRTIFLGIAMPIVDGALGAVRALILAFLKRRLTLPLLRFLVEATTTLSAFVMFILISARVFGLTFYSVNGNVGLEERLPGLPGGEYRFLVVVTIMDFILVCFLDFFEIALIPVRCSPRSQPRSASTLCGSA